MTLARHGGRAGADPDAALADAATDPAAAPVYDRLVLRPEDRLDPDTSSDDVVPTRLRALYPRRKRAGIGGRLVFLALLFGLAALTVQIVGRPVQMPVWLVAEVESRLNRALADALPEGALSIGGIELTLGDDWVPHLVLEDMRLLQSDGQTLVTLPETYVNLDPLGLTEGQLRTKSLRIVGARIAIRRDREGHFVLALGNGQGSRIDNLAGLFDSFDRAFALPALTHLDHVQVEGLSLTLIDLRAGRTWEVGDGLLTIENRDADLAAQLSLSLVAGGRAPAKAIFTAIAAKGAGTARITVQVDKVAARDLAAQTPVLGWLGVLDAPISGRLSAKLDVRGIEALDGRLDIGAGALQPSATTTPIPFDHASLGLGYDPVAGRILLTDLLVQSRTLRVTTKGQAYMVDDKGQTITGALSGRIPAAFLGQIAISDLSVDPEGLFEAPVQFSQGAVDLRLRLDPFTLDIGQFSLTEGNERMGLSGQIAADTAGWRAAIDMTLNKISRDRLLAIWPLRLVPGTRSWVASNIRNAELSDVRGTVRLAPGSEPRTELSYGFNKAELSVMPKMPPVTGADGYATIQGKSHTLVVSRGWITPPMGGPVDVSGTVFSVPDITEYQARAKVDLHLSGDLTAILSLMDQPPFLYLQKAGQPVDLGEGQASVTAEINMRMKPRVMPWDVTFKVAAEVANFASDKLIKGHHVTAPLLRIAATGRGLTISGRGMIGKVPFYGTLAQDLPEEGPNPQEAALQDLVPEGVFILPEPRPVPAARVTGQVTLSQDTVTEFGLGLPRTMVSGQTQADLDMVLPKGSPVTLRLRSDLVGMTLAIPDLGWRKAATSAGTLEAEMRMGNDAQVTRLALTAAGLQAEGKVLLHPNGALDVARFDKVTMGGWLNGAVEIAGHGPSRPVSLAITSGTLDLRKFPKSAASTGLAATGNAISVSAQSVKVADSLRLTGFTGDFSTKGGFNGTFNGSVNGAAPITGTAVPTRNGIAVRIQSDDAGQTMAAAGLFSSAHGGRLDLTLIPRAEAGTYDGTAKVSSIRVSNGSVMAELLSAISVVGLLDQLRGAGIVFENAQAQFLLTPKAIDVQKGSAIGASLGVSLEGLYHSDTERLDMRGVVSPIYLINGIGSVLTRRGEGLFGFAYRLTGPAEAPNVSVNPLSILTPGMFRDLFRAPAPTLAPNPDQTGGGG